MPIWSKLFFQNSNSPSMEHLIFFHDHVMLIILSIIVAVFYTLLSYMYCFSFNRFFLESQEIELFWTMLPSLILMFVAMPSLKTLYLMEENMSPLLSISVTGFQWNWGYDYSVAGKMSFLSTIVDSNMLRLGSVSNRLIVPINVPIRTLVTSKDVLHSWAVPSLGVKMDATPGRLNQVTFMVNRPGVMIGQCSEICGSGHSFMPIFLEAVPMSNFIKAL